MQHNELGKQRHVIAMCENIPVKCDEEVHS
jgi:hypothetical protein